LHGPDPHVPTANNGMVLAVEPFFALLGHFGPPDLQLDASFNTYWDAGWDVDPGELTRNPGLVLENIYKTMNSTDRQTIITQLRTAAAARWQEAVQQANLNEPVLVAYPGALTPADKKRRRVLAQKFQKGKSPARVQQLANAALHARGETGLLTTELTANGWLHINNFINGQNDRGRIVLRDHVRNKNRTHENFLNLINNSLTKCMRWNNEVLWAMRARDALRSGVGRRVRARAAQRQFEEEQDRLMEAEVAAEAEWRRMQRAAVGLEPTGEKTWADEVGDEEEAKKAKLARIIAQRRAEQQALYALGESGLAGYNGGRKPRKSKRKKRHPKQRKTRRA